MRNRNTIEFLGIWEQLNNPEFKPVEFDGFKKLAGLNSFTLTPKQWIESTNAIGIISRAGRYGGTYAQKDIAFEFASWISVEFKLYLIKEFQRYKCPWMIEKIDDSKISIIETDHNGEVDSLFLDAVAVFICSCCLRRQIIKVEAMNNKPQVLDPEPC